MSDKKGRELLTVLGKPHTGKTTLLKKRREKMLIRNEPYKCEHCGKEFPHSYSGKTILGDWRHNSQLAIANFRRHKNSCKSKKIYEGVRK